MILVMRGDDARQTIDRFYDRASRDEGFPYNEDSFACGLDRSRSVRRRYPHPNREPRNEDPTQSGFFDELRQCEATFRDTWAFGRKWIKNGAAANRRHR